MIVLTGGAGFIGSCLLETLNRNGIKDIIVVDRLGSGDKWKNLAGKRFAKFMGIGAFSKAVALDNLENRIDAILHLGACTVTTERDADYIIENNLNYSIALAKYCARKNIRLIYASSAATYGNGSEGYSDKEFENLRPLNAYGLSKHLFDLWVIDNRYEKKFAGLKFFNVFGPNEYHKGDMASMVYKAYNQVKETGKVRLFKANSPEFPDGGQKRDFIYVKDAVECIWKILNDKSATGIFNLGTGKARTWNALAKAVFAAMGAKPEIEYIDMPDSLKGQYQNFTEAKMGKLEKAGIDLNFRSLEESVEDYVKNYLMKDWQHL